MNNKKGQTDLKKPLIILGILVIIMLVCFILGLLMSILQEKDSSIDYNQDYLQGYNDGLDDCITERNVMLEQFKPKEGCNITIFDEYTMREDCD